MIKWLDTSPNIEIADAEYRRLLGFPPGHELAPRAAELMEGAREWYANNGRPWIAALETEALSIAGGALLIGTRRFVSTQLTRQMQEAAAESGFIVLASAGVECETRARRLWEDEKPDEYFFLEILGSAVVEHLIMQAGARLCAWAEEQGRVVLPHYSPGYTGWDIADQRPLFDLALEGKQPWPEEIRLLESGMLYPKKSLLALFGVSSDLAKVRRLPRLSPCETCAFLKCQFRRAPFKEPRVIFEDVGRLQPTPAARSAATPPGLSPQAAYSVNLRALRKWSEQRLQLTGSAQDGFVASFRYEGTTCSNLGWPLLFDYRLKTGPAASGYPILEMACAPATEDTGARRMCAYLQGGDAFLQSIQSEKPLLGKPLESVLGWVRPSSPAGCHCDISSRNHKWGLVLEVVHYALVQREKSSSSSRIG